MGVTKMKIIPLRALPNQRFTFEHGEDRWEMHVGATGDVMFADVTFNDEIILLGSRIVAETPLIPYQYLALAGNFVLLTEDNDMPNWKKFETNQQLVFIP
jgi:hypothetical protein